MADVREPQSNDVREPQSNDYRVTIDADSLTLGEFELLETGRVTDMLKVFDRRLSIEDIAPEDVPAVIREWTLADLRAVAATIRSQVSAEVNPVRAGKN